MTCEVRVYWSTRCEASWCSESQARPNSEWRTDNEKHGRRSNPVRYVVGFLALLVTVDSSFRPRAIWKTRYDSETGLPSVLSVDALGWPGSAVRVRP